MWGSMHACGIRWAARVGRTADCMGLVISVEIIGSLQNVTLHSQLPRFDWYAPGR